MCLCCPPAPAGLRWNRMLSIITQIWSISKNGDSIASFHLQIPNEMRSSGGNGIFEHPVMYHVSLQLPLREEKKKKKVCKRASHSRLTVVSRENYSSVKALRAAGEVTPQLGDGAASPGARSFPRPSPRARRSGTARPAPPPTSCPALPCPSRPGCPGSGSRPLRRAGRPGPGDAAPMGAGLLLLSLSLLSLLVPSTGGCPRQPSIWCSCVWLQEESWVFL